MNCGFWDFACYHIIASILFFYHLYVFTCSVRLDSIHMGVAHSEWIILFWTLNFYLCLKWVLCLLSLLLVHFHLFLLFFQWNSVQLESRSTQLPATNHPILFLQSYAFLHLNSPPYRFSSRNTPNLRWLNASRQNIYNIALAVHFCFPCTIFWMLVCVC